MSIQRELNKRNRKKRGDYGQPPAPFPNPGAEWDYLARRPKKRKRQLI